MSKALTPVEQVREMLSQRQSVIEAFLPNHLSFEMFATSVVSALSATPKLRECSQKSIMLSALQAAQWGMLPNTPLEHCWLVPFKGEAKLLVGYRGQIYVAARSGAVRDVFAAVVYPEDGFQYRLGTNPEIVHEPALTKKNTSDYVAVYAVALLPNGERTFEVMTREEIERIKKLSRYSGSADSPWVLHEDEMRKKSVIHRLFKRIPMSFHGDTSLQAALAAELVEPHINDPSGLLQDDKNRADALADTLSGIPSDSSDSADDVGVNTDPADVATTSAHPEGTTV